MKLDDVASTDDVGWQFVSAGLPQQGTTVTIYDLKVVVALVIFDLNIESIEVYDNDLPLLYFYHMGMWSKGPKWKKQYGIHKNGEKNTEKKHKNTKEKTQNNSYLVNFSDSQSASLHWSHHLPFFIL